VVGKKESAELSASSAAAQTQTRGRARVNNERGQQRRVLLKEVPKPIRERGPEIFSRFRERDAGRTIIIQIRRIKIVRATGGGDGRIKHSSAAPPLIMQPGVMHLPDLCLTVVASDASEESICSLSLSLL